MPTYDYKCKACGHQLEVFQSMKDSPKRKCPSCGKNTLERLIGTGAAVIFKGSGFYQTDYRSESYKKGADAEKPASETKAESKPGSKPDSKTGSAPDTKAESKPTASTGEDKPSSKSKPDSGGKDKKPKAKT